WSNGQNASVATNLINVEYTVTITDNVTGCTIDTTLSMPAKEPPFQITIPGADVTAFNANDGHADVFITGNITDEPSFQWCNGEITFEIENLFPDIYYVTVTDTSNSCRAIDSVEIKEPRPTVLLAGGGVRTICNGNPTETILFALDIDCNNCAFLWNTGETGSDITVTADGEYSITITDDGGCNDSISS